MSDDRYRFSLNIHDRGLISSKYLSNYFLGHQDDAVVAQDPNSGFVTVTIDHSPHWADTGSGQRKLWLDQEKGLMPVRGDFE